MTLVVRPSWGWKDFFLQGLTGVAWVVLAHRQCSHILLQKFSAKRVATVLCQGLLDLLEMDMHYFQKTTIADEASGPVLPGL